MKVLVADKFPETGLAALRTAGCEVEYSPDLDKDGLGAAVRRSAADVLVVRGTEVPGDALLTRLMTSMLFGISAHDPVTMVGVVSRLTFVAFAACYFPARRATRVDPIAALRNE